MSFVKLIAYVLENGKKVKVAESYLTNKDSFKKELTDKGIKFDGVDKFTLLGVDNVW